MKRQNQGAHLTGSPRKEFEMSNLPTTEDRVRKSTVPEVNAKIDNELAARIRLYARAHHDEITQRLEALDREWDMERVLETNAATLILAGTLLGVRNRKWLLLPTVVAGFFFQHAIQGWCPPVTPLRRFGVRTRLEIEKERYALKLLRGDFATAPDGKKTNGGDVEELLHSLDR
jgi:hypothetical protein